MAKETKWLSSTGRPYVDIRDWKRYNEELVVRGEFLLDLEWVNSWGDELCQMNEGKKGHPYEFPESLIKLQAVWNQWVGLRQVEGITRSLVEKAQIPEFNDYTTINRRIRKIRHCFELPKQGFCSVCTDGTGMKMHNAGEYRQMRYGCKHKRWIKVILSANPLTKDMLYLEVSIDGEGHSEQEVAEEHMSNLLDEGVVIDKFWGDGAFDKHLLFNFFERHGIECAIPPRENASTKSRGSMRRAREVAEYQMKTWDDWARDKSYGKRWLGSEVIFSAVKGIFSEHTRAKMPETACLEAGRKFWVYETMRKYAIQRTQ